MCVDTVAVVVKMFIKLVHLLCVLFVLKSWEFLCNLLISFWYSSIECCEG